jgi:hypothetical protein
MTRLLVALSAVIFTSPWKSCACDPPAAGAAPGAALALPFEARDDLPDVGLPWASDESVVDSSSAFACRRRSTCTWPSPEPSEGTSIFFMIEWTCFIASSLAMMMRRLVRSSAMILETEKVSAMYVRSSPLRFPFTVRSVCAERPVLGAPGLALAGSKIAVSFSAISVAVANSTGTMWTRSCAPAGTSTSSRMRSIRSIELA